MQIEPDLQEVIQSAVLQMTEALHRQHGNAMYLVLPNNNAVFLSFSFQIWEKL